MKTNLTKTTFDELQEVLFEGVGCDSIETHPFKKYNEILILERLIQWKINLHCFIKRYGGRKVSNCLISLP